jgi:murein L,D-transpeptidase YafK
MSQLGKFIVFSFFALVGFIIISGELNLPWLSNMLDTGRRTVEKHAPPIIKKRLLPSQKKIIADLNAAGFKMGQPVFIRIFKQEAILELWIKNGKTFALYKTYDICNFSGKLGPKLKEGDKQAPEGFYSVNAKQLNPFSRNHLAFNIAYPNAYDRSYGRTGSALMVHGGCTSIGCYAMRDAQIEEIYRIVEATLKDETASVPVHIFPFKMEHTTLSKHKNNRWYNFWQNLKQGHDLFAQSKTPPKAYVCNGRYAFTDRDDCKPIAGW